MAPKRSYRAAAPLATKPGNLTQLRVVCKSACKHPHLTVTCDSRLARARLIIQLFGLFVESGCKEQQQGKAAKIDSDRVTDSWVHHIPNRSEGRIIASILLKLHELQLFPMQKIEIA